MLGRATEARLGDDPQKLAKTAAALGVRDLVSGSLQRAGPRLRVNIALAEMPSGTMLWAGRVDGDAADVFSLQDQVVVAVATAVDSGIRRAEIARIRTAPPRSHDAFELHLRAIAEIHPITWASCDRALGFLAAAIETDGS